MKQFNDENFLLQCETAQRLYHEYTSPKPIIDYHSHLISDYIARHHQFDNLSKIRLEGDHYKWRAMRVNGIDERYCTGKDTSDWEKFEKWAETVPYTMRNSLYHWTHLELKTAFGVDTLLMSSSAREIYDHCSTMLQKPEFSARGLMRHYNNLVGNDIEQGLMPSNELEFIGREIIESVSYKNAKNYFKF